jgi:hypothetical protein
MISCSRVFVARTGHDFVGDGFSVQNRSTNTSR